MFHLWITHGCFIKLAIFWINSYKNNQKYKHDEVSDFLLLFLLWTDAKFKHVDRCISLSQNVSPDTNFMIQYHYSCCINCSSRRQYCLCVATFAIVPLLIYICLRSPQDIPSCVHGIQNWYFKPNTWCFPNINQVFFVPKPLYCNADSIIQDNNIRQHMSYHDMSISTSLRSRLCSYCQKQYGTVQLWDKTQNHVVS